MSEHNIRSDGLFGECQNKDCYLSVGPSKIGVDLGHCPTPQQKGQNMIQLIRELILTGLDKAHDKYAQWRWPQVWEKITPYEQMCDALDEFAKEFRAEITD